MFCPVLGPVFGSKDNFHGLAIFLDTYPNDEATEVSQSVPRRLFPQRLCAPSASCPEQGRASPYMSGLLLSWELEKGRIYTWR